jgi:3-oxoadipate enol-lactonase
MPHVLSRGARIFYETIGQGPPLVLLQGLGLSSRFWLTAPERLAERFRVVLVDNRGTGRSDRPLGLYTTGLMAQDVLAAVDELGLESFALAGISMGGMIAQEVALRARPGRISGLVLLATTCGLPGGRIPAPSAILTLLRSAQRTPERLQAVRRLLVSVEALDANPRLFEDFERLMAADPVAPGVFLRQLMAASLHSTARRLGRIRCPTLVVTGEEDKLIPPANSRVLAARIPGARLLTLPGLGHAFPLEEREVLGRLLTEFFLTSAGEGQRAG